MADWVLWFVLAIALAIGIIALVLVIVWKPKVDKTIAHDPIEVKILSGIALTPVQPADLVIIPTNTIAISSSRLSEKQTDGTINTIQRIQTSGITVSPPSGDTPEISLAFTLSLAQVGTTIANLNWNGVGVNSSAEIPPLAVLQQPQLSNPTPSTYQFILTWVFGGQLLPQDQEISVSFDLSWSVITP